MSLAHPTSFHNHLVHQPLPSPAPSTNGSPPPPLPPSTRLRQLAGQARKHIIEFLVSPHEPLKLGIFRFITALLVVIPVLAYAGYQIYNLTHWNYIYYYTYGSHTLSLPNMVFAAVLPVGFDISANVLYTPETRQKDIEHYQRFYEPKWNQQVRNGEFDAANWEPDANHILRSKDQRYYLKLLALTMNPNITFTTEGGVMAITNAQYHKATSGLDIALTLVNTTARGIQRFNITRSLSSSIHVSMYLLGHFNMTELMAERDNEPVDLGEVSNASQCTLTMGSFVDAAYHRQDYADSNGRFSTYDIHFRQVDEAPTSQLKMVLGPLNGPVEDNDREYLVPTHIGRPRLSWYDALASVGGAISIATFIFTFLFGQGQWRTWGLVQLRLLRHHMLRYMPQASRIGSWFRNVLQQQHKYDIEGFSRPRPMRPLGYKRIGRADAPSIRPSMAKCRTAVPRPALSIFMRVMYTTNLRWKHQRRYNATTWLEHSIRVLEHHCNGMSELLTHVGRKHSRHVTRWPMPFPRADNKRTRRIIARDSESMKTELSYIETAIALDPSNLEEQLRVLEGFRRQMLDHYLSTDLFLDPSKQGAEGESNIVDRVLGDLIKVQKKRRTRMEEFFSAQEAMLAEGRAELAAQQLRKERVIRLRIRLRRRKEKRAAQREAKLTAWKVVKSARR